MRFLVESSVTQLKVGWLQRALRGSGLYVRSELSLISIVLLLERVRLRDWNEVLMDSLACPHVVPRPRSEMMGLRSWRLRVHGSRSEHAKLIQDMDSFGHVNEVHRGVHKMPAILRALRPQLFVHVNRKVLDSVRLLLPAFPIALRPVYHRVEWLLLWLREADRWLQLGSLRAVHRLARWLLAIYQLSPFKLRLRRRNLNLLEYFADSRVLIVLLLDQKWLRGAFYGE